MVDADDGRRVALSLPGTTEAPHFDRIAFAVRRIYATLGPDKLSINLMLTPGEQSLKCLLAPEIYSPVANAWGRNGATTALLATMDDAELGAVLAMAWEHGRATKPRSRV